MKDHSYSPNVSFDEVQGKDNHFQLTSLEIENKKNQSDIETINPVFEDLSDPGTILNHQHSLASVMISY